MSRAEQQTRDPGEHIAADKVAPVDHRVSAGDVTDDIQIISKHQAHRQRTRCQKQGNPASRPP